MPLPLPFDLLIRWTTWTDRDGSVRQLACALIHEPTWDVLCEMTQQLGPFDEVEDATAALLKKALLARDRQLAGQELLPF